MIHLTEKYYLDSDPKNFILLKEREEKTDGLTERKKPSYEYFYYSDMESLLASLCKRLQRDCVGSLSSLDELIEETRKIKTLISEIKEKIYA